MRVGPYEFCGENHHTAHGSRFLQGTVSRLSGLLTDGWPGTEVGWGLSPEAWGKGYATEGASAAIDWAFDHLGWTDVIHCIDPENTASQAVARRLGSVNRGPGRMPEPFAHLPIDIWGQSREDWRARDR